MQALESPNPVREPHAAVNPRDPDRIAVAAMMEGDGGDAVTRSLYVWQSSDAGGRWDGARVAFPQFDDEGAADPVLAFAPDGTLLVAGMAFSRRLADAMGSAYYTRESVPSTEESVARLMADLEGVEFPDTVVVARLGADGSTVGGTVVRPSAGADKPAMTVDSQPQSPYHGSVYVAWHDMAKHGMLYVARSSDGGRSFAPPAAVVDGPPWGNFISQFAVGPDGSLHVVWSSMVQVLPSAPPGAATSIWHAVSRDGGATFEPPAPIAEHAGLPLIGIPAFAVAPDGSMLVVWGQGTELPADPLAQVRHRLFVTRSDDGSSWSAPVLVSPELPATTSMGLPAVAADGEAWWILTYLSDDVETQVVLLRSDDGGRIFAPDTTLARRAIRVDDIYLHGNYTLLRCADVARVGDYVSVVAHESGVVAAFVLPETDDPVSRTTAYVASVPRL
jgi:hypothetical protein